MEKTDNFCNHYKFGVYVKNTPICERIFSGDEYNQVVKYQIDLRPIISSIQKRVQRVLSSQSYIYNFNEYNTLNYFKLNNLYGYDNLEDIDETVFKINNKTYKGVEVIIGFYINDNPIFERSVYVSRYNPTARFSVELYDTINEIVDDIKDKIKSDDLKLMWEDFDLMSNYNYIHISQVRELSKEDRARQLNKIYNK